MKNIVILFVVFLSVIGCKNGTKNRERILKTSVGRTNMVLTVTKAGFWDGEIGNEIRSIFGQHQVGLPQPETLFSMTQVDPAGFTGSMKANKAILYIQLGAKEGVFVERDRYAGPQVIVFVTAKDEVRLKELLVSESEKIVSIFKNEDIKFSQRNFEKDKLDETQYKTIKDLKISLTIPKSFKLVKDSIGFVWLRQHLNSGIARGDGTNNILIYSLPYQDENVLIDSVAAIRNQIGEQHIPGDHVGMHMITEEAYTPHVFKTRIANRPTIETRGKWEVKGDFMAGPFINFMIVDKPNNRVIVFEGFTYAPSVNKRDFVFELEAIGRSLKVK